MIKMLSLDNVSMLVQQEGGCLQARKWGISRYQIYWHLDFECTTLQKCQSFKSPNLWYVLSQLLKSRHMVIMPSLLQHQEAKNMTSKIRSTQQKKPRRSSNNFDPTSPGYKSEALIKTLVPLSKLKVQWSYLYLSHSSVSFKNSLNQCLQQDYHKLKWQLQWSLLFWVSLKYNNTFIIYVLWTMPMPIMTEINENTPTQINNLKAST